MRSLAQMVVCRVSSGQRIAAAVMLTLLVTSSVALAQTDNLPAGSSVRVGNTDGTRLNLRAGPSTDQPVLAKLPEGTVLTVTGPGRTAGSIRWVPVRDASGTSGWVSAQYLIVQSTPTPSATPTPLAQVVTPTPPPASTSQTDAAPAPKGASVQVEAKLKFPETSGREQEITVWVTRDGAPVPGAQVTVESSDGDEEEKFRQLDPTNAEGWTRRSFSIRDEKGTVELQVEAVAPDGGEGRTTVSYFRR